MVLCLRCESEMLEVDTCTASEPRIVYGTEGFHDADQYAERCPDCAVALGGIHHLGCDVEVCPICGALQRCWCEHRET